MEGRSALHSREAGATPLRLDQIADVYALTQSAVDAVFSPHEELDRLSEILRKKSRFGVVGHTVLTLGLEMIQQGPSPANVAAAALLGTLVGGLKVVNRGLAMVELCPRAGLLTGEFSTKMFQPGWLAPAFVILPPCRDMAPILYSHEFRWRRHCHGSA